MVSKKTDYIARYDTRRTPFQIPSNHTKTLRMCACAYIAQTHFVQKVNNCPLFHYFNTTLL